MYDRSHFVRKKIPALLQGALPTKTKPPDEHAQRSLLVLANSIITSYYGKLFMGPDDYEAECDRISKLVEDQIAHDVARRRILKDELKDFLKTATQEQILEKLLEDDAKLMEAYKNVEDVLYPIRHVMEMHHALISEYNSNLYPRVKSFNLNYDRYVKLCDFDGYAVFYEDGHLNSIPFHKAVMRDAALLISNLLWFFSDEIRKPGSIRNEHYHTYHQDNEHVLNILIEHLGGKNEIDDSDIASFKFHHSQMQMNDWKIMDVVRLGVKKGVFKFK